MPECGWSPKPVNGVFWLSMRSRNTKGFRRRPKSEGDMRRVMGPCFCPLVRLAIREREPCFITTASSSLRHHVEGDVDVSSCCLGIWARLVRGGDYGLSGFTIQARQSYVEACLEEVLAIRAAQIHFRVDSRFRRKSDPHLSGSKAHRTFKAGRPTGGEQLLGVCAIARSAGNRQSNVQPAIVAARGACPATRRMGLSRIHDFLLYGHRGFLHLLFSTRTHAPQGQGRL